MWIQGPAPWDWVLILPYGTKQTVKWYPGDYSQHWCLGLGYSVMGFNQWQTLHTARGPRLRKAPTRVAGGRLSLCPKLLGLCSLYTHPSPIHPKPGHTSVCMGCGLDAECSSKYTVLGGTMEHEVVLR